MQQLTKTLLSLSVVSTVLVGCSSSTSSVSTTTASNELSGTYSIYVQGYDWGAGVNKAILKLDQSVSNVDESDFTVTETKQTTDWSDETYPVIETTVDRTVEKAYASDKDGNPVDDASEYVTLELYCSPNDGSPLLYSAITHYNTWSDPYYLEIELSDTSDITVDDTKVETLSVETIYTDKVTTADAISLDSYTGEDGITLEYGHYEPEETSDTVFVWLHGSGEGGVDNTDPHVTSLANKVTAYLSDEFQETLGGANILVPQCPTYWMDADGNGGEWDGDLLVTHGPSYYTKTLKELIDSYKKEVGATQVVVSGCSAGGYMTMRMILDYPDYFTAAIPICEALPDEVISDEELEGIKDLPVYFIYSEDDSSVDPTKFEEPTIKRLEELGASNLHVSTSETVIDTSETYNDLNDGKPYQYNGHWSWIYFDNNEADCDEHGEKVWEWIAEQLN